MIRVLLLAVLFALCGILASVRATPAVIAPNGLAIAPDGTLYISDIGTHRVVKLQDDGEVIVVAGNGKGAFGGDGGAATNAFLFAPMDVTFDRDGNLLIADTYNHRVRRVDRRGVITTVAGNGKAGYKGDNGPALDAALDNPQGIAADEHGHVYVADTYNHVVRRVDRNGIMTTFAGTEAGLAGDGGPANKAQISLPMAVAIGPDKAIYICDAGNSRIRRVDTNGIIQTIAGQGGGAGLGGAGFSGDGGRASKAKLFAPADIVFDSAGNIYISDSGNNRVRIIRDGVIATLAGAGRAGYGGDGSSAVEAALNTPQKIAVDKDGNVFIADRANQRVRKVDPEGGMATILGIASPGGTVVDPERSRVQKK